MGLICLAENLGRLCDLDANERAALDALNAGTRQYRRGAVIRRERERCDDIMVVEKGWLFCSTLLEDGRRQIIRFHFRGDLLGADCIAFAESPTSTAALTDVEVCLLDRLAFRRLFTDHPRLGALLYAMTQIDRVTLTDQLTSLGRNSARGRIAALLLGIAGRLRLADPAITDSFVLPMTQEEIGDATGLTGVHVNRTLRALEEQGLIERARSMLRIVDADRLARVANQPRRRARVDPNWLPPAR